MDAQTKAQIEGEIASTDVVLFMKGTPIFRNVDFPLPLLVFFHILALLSAALMFWKMTLSVKALKSLQIGRPSAALCQR